MKQKLIDLAVNGLIILLRSLQWFFILMVWFIYVLSFVALFILPYWLIIYPILILVVRLIIKLKHMTYLKYATQNVIIHGGRGKGKGLLFQYVYLKEREILSNVPFGKKTTLVQPSKYFNSIAPNTSLKMIKGEHAIVQKNEAWEGVPYFLDDTAVYFPNYNDNQLKVIYPSMSLFLPIQRHLYNSYTIINAQDINRTYKILRELQTDGYIKALGTYGTGYIWNRLPVLRKYLFVKWRYHENLESAINNRLPFEKLGMINRGTERIYTSTASALKEQYEGQNGHIQDGYIWIKKKHIEYDTRYFHELIFGVKA